MEQQMTTNKQIMESPMERQNFMKSENQMKTIKKKQVAALNCRSCSPFKETIITIPKEINPKIRNQILEREKEIFARNQILSNLTQRSIQNTEINGNFSFYGNSFRTEDPVKSQDCEKSFMNMNEKDREIIRKINTINEVLGVDLSENIDKFYQLSKQVQEEKSKKNSQKKEKNTKKDQEKQTKSYRKDVVASQDNSPQINVFQVPTIPIEDFMDETEITIKQMKQDVTEELQALYGKVVKNVKG